MVHHSLPQWTSGEAADASLAVRKVFRRRKGEEKTTNVIAAHRATAKGAHRPSLSLSFLPGAPLKSGLPLRVVIAAADRQGGRSNDASSVNQAISFLRDQNEDSAEAAIDFSAVAQLSQLPGKLARKTWSKPAVLFRPRVLSNDAQEEGE